MGIWDIYVVTMVSYQRRGANLIFALQHPDVALRRHRRIILQLFGEAFHLGVVKCEWIGFVGKILTGNHGFYHHI